MPSPTSSSARDGTEVLAREEADADGQDDERDPPQQAVLRSARIAPMSRIGSATTVMATPS